MLAQVVQHEAGQGLRQEGCLDHQQWGPSQHTCLCLRTENRSRKTHVFEYRDCGVGWGGVGGHVKVPCTSYMIYCHAAKISGIIYYVTCCYAAEISGIVYYVTYMLLRC